MICSSSTCKLHDNKISSQHCFLSSSISSSTNVHTLVSNLMMQVSFLGEAGQDGGGPSREFWCDLAREGRDLFEGEDNNLVISHDYTRLQVKFQNNT